MLAGLAVLAVLIVRYGAVAGWLNQHSSPSGRFWTILLSVVAHGLTVVAHGLTALPLAV